MLSGGTMLRWLISWCVPGRALRFDGDLTHFSASGDAADRGVLFRALASHGVDIHDTRPAANHA
jgi:hypothetical protein